MTYEEIIERVKTLGEDADYYEYTSGTLLTIIFNDFDGFDENWNEIDREYDNPEAVEQLITDIAEAAENVIEGYINTYDFGTFAVKIEFTSMDI